MLHRCQTKRIKIGGVEIGGGAPVAIQSMTTTDTADVQATLKQIRELKHAGCEIVRVAVPDKIAASSLKEIVAGSPLPIIADIHFDYRLALLSIKAGVAKLRLNPGNIGGEIKLAAVAKAAQHHGIPIRIGVNSGSLEREILERYSRVTAEAMVESALKHTRFLEKVGFKNIVLSFKATNVPITFKAYKLIAEKTKYPLHLGITEAGTQRWGIIKSSIGIGALLLEGIGDTIRVSLTADPVEEIKVARNILQAVGLRSFAPEVISCPTCGRCRINLIQLTEEVERKVEKIDLPLKIAVMGCVVNGPGEAREADLGICGGKEIGAIFKKGKIIKKVPSEKLLDSLIEEIEAIQKGAKNKAGKQEVF
ncbi:MAG: flavodoxin-dependent (E)-4-hydroxy-3-methylbut-2-enyl-diphosphate synthase [Firmicutes bacterium]|nr:flavodoxin-dependent (E)-4-hydroxy-3-methylbut-2-enyl-diphosphate synthase [Bacillota bacterium]